jgi:hypothetical protein
MGLFSRRPPEPQLYQCPCGEAVRDKLTHWDTHIVEVTLASGRPALTYDCPLCGLGEEFWNTEEEGRSGAPFGFGVHLMAAHHIGL